MTFETFTNDKKLNEELITMYKEKLEMYKSKVQHYENLIEEKKIKIKKNIENDEDDDEEEYKNNNKNVSEKTNKKKKKTKEPETESDSESSESENETESENEDSGNNNVEGFTNFKLVKERFATENDKWKLRKDPKFYFYLGLRSLLYACLFYILANKETVIYVGKYFKTNDERAIYILMAVFFAFYYALNIFI